MRLIVAKTKPEKPVAAALWLSARDGNDINKIKVGSVLYPFTSANGQFASDGTVGLYSETTAPIDPTDPSQADASEVFNVEANPAFDSVGDKYKELVSETRQLKGSRLAPVKIQVKKVTKVKDSEAVIVEGQFFNAYDPRLPFLSPEEGTMFGTGTFSLDKVKGTYDGGYWYDNQSHLAELIEAKVNEQVDLFHQLADTPQEDTKKQAKIKDQLNDTVRYLKSHAGEVYKQDNDLIYYIDKQGRWRTEDLPGMRAIDLFDRVRMQRWMETNGLTGENTDDTLDARKNFHQVDFLNKFYLESLAPILHRPIMNTKKEDLAALTKKQENFLKLKPKDGPLKAGDLPGMRKEVNGKPLEVFPHQSYILAALKDEPRMVVDADPSAGKTFIIIADILQQMKADRVKRPLVVMPESLLHQFASEIKHFSELNPWIITTSAINDWKEGELPEFIKDAQQAPPNTMFLTSYNWISRDPEGVMNGNAKKLKSEKTGEEKMYYEQTKVFPRSSKTLLKELQIDAVYLDECHQLKNESNHSWAAITLARVPIVRGLTGTLMPGNPVDVLGSVGAVHSGVFGTEDDFIENFTKGSIKEYNDDGPKSIRDKLLSYGVPQVRNTAWAHLLPKKEEFYHFVNFTDKQQKAYDLLLTNIVDEIKNDPKMLQAFEKFESSLEDGEEVISSNLLARFTPLEVFLNAPGKAHKLTEAALTGDDRKSPKIPVIAEIIQKHLAKNEGKVLVFVQYKEAAKELLEGMPTDIRAVSKYYEGGMTDVFSSFKDPASDIKVLFGVDNTLKTGHNIQAANAIIHADLPWLPGDVTQRNARSARIGQAHDVAIHYVLVENSAEMLKKARIIAMEHIVAKANSNFDEKVYLNPITMTLNNMKSFRKQDQLQPFLERQKAIRAQSTQISEREREFYGETMLTRKGSVSITEVFADAKILTVVPASRKSKVFTGMMIDEEAQKERELGELPSLDSVKPVKLLDLSIQEWDDTWYLTCWKTSDPNGFLRVFGFDLIRDYYGYEIASKSGADPIIDKIERRKIDVLNKTDLKVYLQKARMLKPGRHGLIKQMQLDSKKTVQGYFLKDGMSKWSDPAYQGWVPKEVRAGVNGEVVLHFAMIDGYPYLYVSALDENEEEIKILKSLGFTHFPAMWAMEVTRTGILQFFRKLRQRHKDIEITNWLAFKENVQTQFRGLSLDEFDDMGAEALEEPEAKSNRKKKVAKGK